MKEHVDEQVWRGLERRIGQVEKFIPATQPPWRGSRPAITPSIRVVPGSAFGEASRGRRSRGGRGWIRVLVAVAVAIALVIGAILAGGGHQPPPIEVPSPRADQGFIATGSLNDAEVEPTATALSDGRVLIVGILQSGMNSAELFDPQTGVFSATGSMVPSIKQVDSATLLADGRVLLTSAGDASAELYDPVTGTFRLTGSMSTRRWTHTATLLADGQVLMAGGKDGDPVGTILSSAELYDPQAGVFRPTGSMSSPRMLPTASLLADGRVLIVGGDGGDASAETYDPRTGRFIPAGHLNEPRQSHTATTLADGRVLVLGGWDYSQADPVPRTSAEVYDPTTGAFLATGSMELPRIDASAILLPDGRVLVTGGGLTGTGIEADTRSELYDPATGTFSFIGSTTMVPYLAAATMLRDGDVLIAGGLRPGTGGPVLTALLFDYRRASPP